MSHSVPHKIHVSYWEDEIPHKSWINITAEVHVEFAKEYKGKGPVLYPISVTPAEKPEDELVYFS